MSRCVAILAAVLFSSSLASASVNDAGVNLGAGEIDRKVEELLKKSLNDVNAFTSEYLISNGLKVKLDLRFGVNFIMRSTFDTYDPVLTF